MIIKLPAYLTGWSPRKDFSYSIRFETQELTDSELLDLKNAQNQFGWMVFSSNELQIEDIPTELAEDKQKTPSKRLRNVIFVLWKQQGSVGDFEIFYKNYVEKLIEKIKAQLD